MGYLKSTGTVFIYIGLFLTLVAFLPGIPPDAQFSEFSIVPPHPGLIEGLKLNRRLENAEILFKGELKGPESFASYNGELYTTLHGGDIVKIVGKHIVPIAKFGKPCDGIWMEKKCGRPLGLQFDKNGVLYVVDPYTGIFRVDVASGKYERIVDISKPIEGVVPKLANSLDIATNGDIYWSDSSREFILQDGVYTCLANPSGRLIKYDAAAKKNVVLINNLGFANGVKLSKDESFVIVAETLVSRITKFNLKGNKAGRAEPFVEGLPGLPDNIHTDGGDGFLVSLVLLADPEHPVIVHTLAPHPNIRRMLARLLYLLETPFKLIEDVYPNYYSQRVVHWIGHFESIQSLHPETVGVLRIDAAGKVIDSASSFDGKIGGISSAYVLKDHIYLGSPYNEYLARVQLSQAFPSIKMNADDAREKVIEKPEFKETVKPVAQPVPTTTPAPPTTTPAPPTTTPALPTTTPAPPTTTPAPPTTTPAPPTTTPAPPTTTPAPPTTTTTQKPKTVPTTPKPATAAPTTTPPPPQQQQQQGAPKPTKSSTEASPEQARPVPASSSPPPPPPPNKVPVKEATPTQQGAQKQAAEEPSPSTGQQASPKPPSKPASNEQAAKNVEKTEDATKKTATNPGNGEKPPPPSKAQQASKPAPVASQNVKDAEAKKQGETVKPPVTTPPPPRN